MTNILVTGGTGFIGSGLVKGLVEKGYNVRIFDNNFRGNNQNLDELRDKIELFEGDIRDKRAVMEAVKGMDTIFHLAFINGTENFYKHPELVMEVGIKGHFNIMEAAKESGINTFVYASSSEVYQTPPIVPTPEDVPCSIPDVHNPRYSYGGSKLLGELLTLHYPLAKECKKIIFRPHNIYGPAMGFEHVIPQIVKKIYIASDKFQKLEDVSISIQGSGIETRAFCYIDDAVDGIITLSAKGLDSEIYHLGVDDEVQIIELVKKIGNILHVDLKIVHEDAPQGGTPRRCPDINKLRSLGYDPQITLDEGLEKTVLWYRDYYIKQGDIL